MIPYHAPQRLRSGTTIVCALLDTVRPTTPPPSSLEPQGPPPQADEEPLVRMTLGWCGDSQAMIVRNGQPVQIMQPHKPERLVSNGSRSGSSK